MNDELYLPDYLIIPSIIMGDKELQPLDGYVYGVVYWFNKLKLEKCTLTNQQISKLLHASASGVSHSLSRLSQKRHVEIVMDRFNQREEIIPLIFFASKNDFEVLPSEPSLKQTRRVAEMSEGGSSNKHYTINNKIKEDNKKNNQSEPDGSGIKFYKKRTVEPVGNILKDYTVPIKKSFGASYAWQDTAVRWWKKLGLDGKPTAGWFRIFKIDENMAERSCSFASDSGAKNIEKITYWAFNQYKKHGKIKY